MKNLSVWTFRKKYCLYFLVVMLCVLMLAINLSGSPYASVYFGFAPRLVPIYCVETDKKQVAISFDSAWGADKTEGIIEILNTYNVSATFFVVGFWAEDYPDILKKLVDNGIEIGTHSNTHPDFTKLSSEQAKLELTTSIDIIKKVTNTEITLFRPPFGAYNNNMLNIATSLGLKTIQWDVDTLDWKGISASEIVARVVNKVQNGSIILCHNNAKNIVEALPTILQKLIGMGYDVTSVGKLIYHDNYTIDNLGVQRSVVR